VVREAVVDHRLRRHALVDAVRRGARPADEVRDAPRELLRAAAHLGLAAGEPCPVCGADALVVVAFVEEPGERERSGGRAVAADAVETLANRRGSVTLHEVEVCRGCAWHHLRTTSRVRAVPPGATVTANGA
jgi:hypothetical protein